MEALGTTEAHGPIVHGITAISTTLGTTADGTTLGITEVSMTLGIMEVFMIHGTMDGMAVSMVITIADGTAHGILSDHLCIQDIITEATSLIMLTYGEAQDIRQVQTSWQSRKTQAAEV